MQTIREAKIVVHLESGPANLKIPDISGFLRQQEQALGFISKMAQESERLRASQQSLSTPTGAATTPAGGSSSEQLEKQLNLTKQLVTATEQLAKAVESAGSASRGSGGGGSSSGTAWKGVSGVNPDREARERERLLKIMEEEERATQRLRGSMSALAGSAQQVGEGFFRIGRAAVLLGAGNDSIQQMIVQLAQVQAYWDLMSGTISIVQGLINAQKALAAAQAVYVVALGASALATQAFAVAAIEATAAVVGFLIPFAILAAVIAAPIIAGVALWNLMTESEEEAAEAAKKHAEYVREGSEKAAAALTRELELRLSLNKAMRDGMSFQEQQNSNAADIAGQLSLANSTYGSSKTVDPAAEQAHLKIALDAAERAKSLNDEMLENARKRRDEEVKIREEKIKQIEAQEKILASAEKQKKVAEDQLKAFQAQVGGLASFEQQRLTRIRDDLRAGRNVNQFDEEFFAENAGERGKRVIDERRAGRAGAAGFGDDFFDGLKGAGDGVKGATDEVAKATKALADLITKLGETGSAAEAKAKYEAEIKGLQAAFLASVAEHKKMNDQIMEIWKKTVERLAAIEHALITG